MLVYLAIVIAFLLFVGRIIQKKRQARPRILIAGSVFDGIGKKQFRELRDSPLAVHLRERTEELRAGAPTSD